MNEFLAGFYRYFPIIKHLARVIPTFFGQSHEKGLGWNSLPWTYPPILYLRKSDISLPTRSEVNFTVRLFSKCNALQCLYRHIDGMRCLNATFYALFSERCRGRNAEKKLRNAAEFLGSILHHANLFLMLWVRAAIRIRLDGAVMHYKL